MMLTMAIRAPSATAFCSTYDPPWSMPVVLVGIVYTNWTERCVR